MAGCQPFKLSSGGVQPLTPWMGIHGKMSAIQIELRRCTANSHTGWEFMAEYQPFKLSSGDVQPLTPWMGIHGKMSAIQIELRRCTATHKLDGNSWQDVSHSN